MSSTGSRRPTRDRGDGRHAAPPSARRSGSPPPARRARPGRIRNVCAERAVRNDRIDGPRAAPVRRSRVPTPVFAPSASGQPAVTAGTPELSRTRHRGAPRRSSGRNGSACNRPDQHQQVGKGISGQQIDACPSTAVSLVRAHVRARTDTDPLRPTPRSAVAAAGSIENSVEGRTAVEDATEIRQAPLRRGRRDVVQRRAIQQDDPHAPAAGSRSGAPRRGRGASARLGGSAGPTRHEGQDDGGDDRDAEERATDPTATAAESVVNEGDEQQHASGDRQGQRDHHRAPARRRRQGRLEGRYIQPRQQGPRGDDEGGRPGEDAQAEPARPRRVAR